MRVRCHACARIWEVLDPEEWGESMRAECAYCGRPHTLDECRESQTEREPKMEPRIFHIGDKVKRKAFTDCFGKFHPTTPLLVVVSIKTIGEDVSSVPHHRLKAENPASAWPEWYEGAERFFEGA